MIFSKHNQNPKGWKTGDCVVRAISYATGKTWQEVFQDLCQIGAKKCRMPDDPKVYETYLDEQGWEKHPQPRRANGKKFTVEELIDLTNWNYNGTLIMTVANHMTVADGIELIDTWDCSYKTVGNYWTKG